MTSQSISIDTGRQEATFDYFVALKWIIVSHQKKHLKNIQNKIWQIGRSSPLLYYHKHPPPDYHAALPILRRRHVPL